MSAWIICERSHAMTVMREGGCTCGAVRYRMDGPPMIVHACHCTWCQRETGSAFAINAVIEAARVTVLCGQPVAVMTPSASGRGQRIWRCPACHVALWSNYPDAGPKVNFIRVGTLDDPGALPPDIHIFTATRLAWVQLPDGVPAVPEFYDRADIWSADALKRWAATRG
ncbi:MAG: GFA family protein [Pseudomonadota bacterium]|nr:GFA family protein [Pseudomonadota bacterium]